MNKYFRQISTTTKNIYYKIQYRQMLDAFTGNTHLTLEERVILYRLAKNCFSVAEIGSYVGASACCFAQAIMKNNRGGSVICIDTWDNDAMSEGKWDTWIEFSDNTKRYQTVIKPMRGFSLDVISKVREQVPSIDLLFIDGDHSYSGVKADWDAYSTLLVPGSTVVFHDYGWAEGVRQVVHEDVMPLVSGYNMVPNMWWGQIARTT